LLFIVSGASFISKKKGRTRILKKISPKTYPLDPGSGSATLVESIQKQETVLRTRIAHMILTNKSACFLIYLVYRAEEDPGGALQTEVGVGGSVLIV
jgi:hypothetical protein